MDVAVSSIPNLVEPAVAIGRRELTGKQPMGTTSFSLQAAEANQPMRTTVGPEFESPAGQSSPMFTFGSSAVGPHTAHAGQCSANSAFGSGADVDGASSVFSSRGSRLC